MSEAGDLQEYHDIPRISTEGNCNENNSSAIMAFKTEDDIRSKNFKTHSCAQYDKRFYYPSGPTEHITTVRGIVKKHVCEQCNRAFYYASHLIAHIDIIHKGVKTHICDICGKAFAYKSHLKTHINGFHKGIRNHHCECGKSFHAKADLKRHADIVHLGDQNYVCDICGTPFRRKSTLNIHIAAFHKKSNPEFPDVSKITCSPGENQTNTFAQSMNEYLCGECGKEFSSKGDLKDHVECVHLEIKIHQCPECGKVCSQKSNLTAHINRVHKSMKPHCCEFCGTGFFTKSDLKSHCNSVHKNGLASATVQPIKMESSPN